MKIVSAVLLIPLVLLVVLSLGKTLFADDESRDNLTSQAPVVVPQLQKPEIAHKMKKLNIPFIANNGQVEGRVKYYANTFGGTVFVTKEGEIVYTLPGSRPEDASSQLKVGSSECRGELCSLNKVSPLKRGEYGVCNTIPIHHDTGKTHPRPLFIEGSNKDSYTGYVMQYPGKDSNIKTSCILHHSLCIPYPGCIWDFLREDNQQSSIINPKSKISGIALREEFIGAKISQIKGEGSSATKVSYFKGNDPTKWKNNISTYDLVDLGDVYDGIGLRLKAYGNNVEKLFCVKPGASPELIKIRLSGAKDCRVQNAESGIENQKLSVNRAGELEVETELGPVKFTKPVAYQEINGKRVEVGVEYAIRDRDPSSVRYSKKTNTKNRHAQRTHIPDTDKGHSQRIQPTDTDNGHDSRFTTYSFKVASYDKTKDLIIDPLLASTYLGGDQADVPNCITLDNDGNIYVAGWTGSHNLPAPSDAYDTSNNGGYGSCDSFLAKLSGDLTQLLAATYLGGNSIEFITSIVIDKEKNVFVSGYTGNGSPEFPTTEGTFDTSWNGSNYTLYNGFVSKFNGNLTQLLASTYLGGSGYDGDFLRSMAIDQNGNIYVTGDTDSRDFPISSSAYDTSLNSRDGFISKLNGDLSAVIASTFFGGSQQDDSNSIAIDSDGNVYITGFTSSSDLPTTDSAYDTTYNGYGYYYWMGDAFVSKLNGNLSELLASTLLGGTKSEHATSVAIDKSGNIYVTGWTHSSDFPVSTDAYDTYFDGNDGGYWESPKGDVFVSKLSNDLKELLKSTYLGGSSNDSPSSITVDSVGNVYVVGSTNSSDFPTTADAFEVSFGGSNNDGFISKLNRYLTTLLTSTYLGGDTSEDSVNSIAIKSTGDIYVAGHTMSSGFSTTTDAYDTSFNGSVFIPYWGTYGDAFLSKFSLPTSYCNADSLSISKITPETGGDTGSVTMTIYGCEFQGSATVKLARDDQPDIEADPVTVSDGGESITATFDLTDKARGVWDVVVTNPDSSSVTKEDAFTIEEGKEADVWVNIVGRERIRRSRPSKFYITYGNNGNVDAVGAIVGIAGIPTDVTLKLDQESTTLTSSDGTEYELKIPFVYDSEDMGKVFTLVLDTIPPGYTKTVPFSITVPSSKSFEIQLYEVLQ